MLQVRALCTYHGQGTQYVANKHADRRWVQRMLFSDTQGYGLKDPSALQQASPGDVLILKGHAYPGNAGGLRWPALCCARAFCKGVVRQLRMCNGRVRSCAQITTCQPRGDETGVHSG